MDYPELNHVLIDMVPHMRNLTTGAAIAPSSKKVLLRDIVKKWEAAKHTTTDPLDHKTMSFDNRFPDVIQVLKDEVHAIAESEDPDQRKLITTDGKCAIPDIVAYALEEFLLRGHGSDSAPSIGKSEYGLYTMFQCRVGCRAQIESANMMKRHFEKDKIYGWPGYKHVFDLAQKNNQCNKKMKLPKPEPHFIIDPDFISLMEYMRNEEYNPGPYLLNKPTFTAGHRTRDVPHFKNEKYAPGTVGNWTGNLIVQLINNHPKHGNNRFSLAHIFKVRLD
jgi:hypothetical protein